jgi:tetratricopeptide (TPR) repeat protein
VVVLDFGLSIDLGSPAPGLHLPAGEEKIAGTIGYMAPEQASGLTLTPASDWYSVGVMLYEALTGHLPFEGTPEEVIVAKQGSEPRSPAAEVPGVPEDLEELCVELLSREPERRPSSRAILARLNSGVATSGRVGTWTSSGRGAGFPLIGRERHLQALAAALETVKTGRPVLMLVSGRSGSGKTTLVQTFLGGLGETGEVVVLSGRCFERESVPYKALDSVVDALSRFLKTLRPDALAAVLPPDLAPLARMFPVLQRVEPVAAAPRESFKTPDQQELRRRALDALRELLARIALTRALVIAIDDLQWGDTENFALIEELIRPPAPPRLLLVGSYRTEDAESSPLIRALRRQMSNVPAEPADPEVRADADTRSAPDRRELVVDPLTESESRELALVLLGRRDAEARVEAHLVAKESHGNPFFIDELVKHIVAGERLSTKMRSAEPGARSALDDVLWERVSQLPEHARKLLEVVSVSGRPVSLLDAFQAADLPTEGRAAAATLRAGRLIRGTGQPTRDEVETYHDWVRETVVARLPPDVLAAHHLRLARVLEGSPTADPERLAVHYQGARQPERAAELYAKAADRAAETLAFFHAAKLYRLALFLRRTTGTADEPVTAPPAGEPVRLRTRLGDALANAGRGRDAASEYLKAAAAANPAEALELRRRGAMQLLISGNVDEGLDVLHTVLEAMRMSMPATPTAALASLVLRRARLRLHGLRFRVRDASQVSAESLALIDLCWSAGAGLSMIQPVRGADFHARGLLLALRAGEPYRVARSLTLEVMHSSLPGRSARRRTEAILARAEELARRVAHPHVDGMVALARGFAALMCGSWKQAHHGILVAEPILRDRCTGVAWEIDTANNLSLLALTHLGELRSMRRIWAALLREARERGDRYAVTTLNTFYMTILRLADDEPETARRELDEVSAHLSHGGFHIHHSAHLRAEAALDLYLSNGTSACERMEAAWPAYKQSLLGHTQMIRVLLVELRGRCALAAAVETRDPRALLGVAQRCARALEKERVPWAQAHATMLRAGLASLDGDLAGALALLDGAASRYDLADMPLHAASARRRLGLLLGGNSGRALVEAADALFSSQGVNDPGRFAAMYAPAFLDEEETSFPSGDLPTLRGESLLPSEG